VISRFILSVDSLLVNQLRTAVFEAGGRFGNLEEEKRPPLEAVTRRLVKTQQTEKI
jgi:hypothetical protein